METQHIEALIMILVAIIGYFLKLTMETLKKVREMATETKARLDLVENNHQHLASKFDQLYEAVKDLTTEIKHLTIQLAKKKDIDK